MKNILITGINGFTGTYFQQYIIQNRLHETYQFYGIDVVTDQCETIVDCRTVDLKNKKELKAVLVDINPDFIIHLAGSFSAVNFDDLVETNANATKKLLQTLVEEKLTPQKILIIGSAAEYGTPYALPIDETSALNPISAYGVSKAIQTFYALHFFNAYKTPCVIARPFNFIGKGVSANLSVGSFLEQIEQAESGDVISVGNIETQRDFIHISDAVGAYWKLLMAGIPGEIYNVCSGKPVYIRDVLNKLIDQSGKKLQVKVDPKRVKENDIDCIFGDNRKITNHIGWQCRMDLFDLSHQ